MGQMVNGQAGIANQLNGGGMHLPVGGANQTMAMMGQHSMNQTYAS